MIQYETLENTLYFYFAANDTSGSGNDGAAAAAHVRLAGAATSAAPVISPAPSLLSEATYPAGCYEVAVAATAANGFVAGNTYAVFCTLAVDSQNPSGFIGSFKLSPIPANLLNIANTAVAGPDDLKANLATLEGRLTAARAANLDNLDAAISTRLATAGYTAPDNAGIAAILVDTTFLETLFLELTEDDGSGNNRYTAKALEQAPAGAGGGDATAANQVAIIDLINNLNNLSVADIRDMAIDGGYTLAQVLRAVAAATAGVSSGGGTGTLEFHDMSNAKTRLTATVDANGNRTGMVYNDLG